MNIKADLKSRDYDSANELHDWAIVDWAYHRICALTQLMPSYDLFAVQANARAKNYMSKTHMAGSAGVDATVFSLPSGQPALYATPPPNLIGRFVQRLPAPSPVILVTPKWPREIWYPMLTQIAEVVTVLPQSAFDLGPVGRPHFLTRRANATSFVVWKVEAA